MRTPTLPFGRKAPWILAGLALALIAWGVITHEREPILVGAVVGVALVLAFPVAGWVNGPGEPGE